MSYLLDTNVVSELMKTPGDPAATSWIARHEQTSLFLSVVALMELRRGIQAMPMSGRRLNLNAWLSEDLPVRFADRILPLDAVTADICGQLLGDRRLTPAIRRIMDFWLAATALQHDLSVVTRNERDFRDLGIRVVNPSSA